MAEFIVQGQKGDLSGIGTPLSGYALSNAATPGHEGSVRSELSNEQKNKAVLDGHAATESPSVAKLQSENSKSFGLASTSHQTLGSYDLEGSKKRSRTGCYTCKLRKKRCDEVKPKCGDCTRLKRQCVYIDESLDPREAEDIKMKMQLVERNSKTRKRKRKDEINEDSQTVRKEVKVSLESTFKQSRTGKHVQFGSAPETNLESNGNNRTLPFKEIRNIQNTQQTSGEAHLDATPMENFHDSNKIIFNPLALDLMGSFATPTGDINELSVSNSPPFMSAILYSNMPGTAFPGNNEHPPSDSFKLDRNRSPDLRPMTLPNQNHNSYNKSSRFKDSPNLSASLGPISSGSRASITPLDSEYLGQSHTTWESSPGPNFNISAAVGSPNILSKNKNISRIPHALPFTGPSNTHEHGRLSNQGTPLASGSNPTNDLDDQKFTPLSELFSSSFPKIFQEHLQALVDDDDEEARNQVTRNKYSSGVSLNSYNTSPSYFRQGSVGAYSKETTKEDIDSLAQVFDFKTHGQASQSQVSPTMMKIQELHGDEDEVPLDTSTGDRDLSLTMNDNYAPSDNLLAYQKYIHRQQLSNPTLYTNPSIPPLSSLASLSPVGERLFEYYKDNLSHRISTLPNEQNNYLTTILPMAHLDNGVLYGVIALGAFHLGGAKMEKYGNYYLQKAIEHFQLHPILEEEKDPNFYREVKDDRLILMDENKLNSELSTSPFEDFRSVDSLSPDDSKAGTNSNNGYNERNKANKVLGTLSQKDLSNIRLASYLILCAVEICRGDVRNWVKYLEYGAKLIESNGGLTNFGQSKDEQFLVASYAYHDMQAATTMHQEGQDGLHFKFSKYEELWQQQTDSRLDSLHGISSKIFKIIAEINILAMESRIMLRKVGTSLSDNFFINKAKTIPVNDPIQSIVGGGDEDSDFSSSEDEEVLKDNISVDSVFNKKKRRRGSTNNSEDYDNDELSPLTSTTTTPTGHIASSSEWLKTQVQNQTREEAEANNEYQTRFEALDKIMMVVNRLEETLDDVRPDESQLSSLSDRDMELQLTAFECFQITAKIHLRQSIMKVNSSSLTTQHLLAQLIRCLDILLGSPIESCLCFPMFIAGMNCISKKDRKSMKKKFNEFIKRYRWKNVLRAKIVMKEVWKKDSNGNTCVDWFEIVRKLGWDLSFA